MTYITVVDVLLFIVPLQHKLSLCGTFSKIVTKKLHVLEVLCLQLENAGGQCLWGAYEGRKTILSSRFRATRHL